MPVRKGTTLAIILTIAFVLVAVGAREQLFGSDSGLRETGARESTTSQQPAGAAGTTGSVQLGEAPVSTVSIPPADDLGDQPASSAWTDDEDHDEWDDDEDDDHDATDQYGGYDDDHDDSDGEDDD